MHPQTSDAPAPPLRWWLLAVATLQQAGLTLVRFGLPALAPFVRADLGLSLAQTGAVLGAFDLGALLAFYLTGLATDRWGERRVMAAGAVTTGLLTAAASRAPSLPALALLLAAAGVGFPSSQVAGSHAVMGWFPARERGLAMGVRQAGLPIGGLTGALVLPWAAGRYGWRAALLLAAAGCTLAGVVTWAGLAGAAEPEAPALPARVPQPVPSFWEAPRLFLADRALVLTTLAACLLAAGQFSLTGYLPLYMVDAFGWPRAAGARLLLLVHTGGIVGRLGWGWVSDRGFGADRVRPLSIVAAACAGAAAGVAALDGVQPLPAWLAGGAALLGGLTLLGWNGLYITLLSELAGPASAVMLGLSMTALYVWTMLSPPAFGWLVQRASGRYPVAWAAVSLLQVGAALAAGAVGRALAAARHRGGWPAPAR